MMETIEMLRKRIVDARAVGDSDFEQTALAMFQTFGQRLEHALRRYADKIVEAACCNNAQRLRELHDGLRALRTCLEEWRLVAEELGVFSRASASGSVSGGDGCCSPYAPAASFTEGSDA
jgi:hypothetical protein